MAVLPWHVEDKPVTRLMLFLLPFTSQREPVRKTQVWTEGKGAKCEGQAPWGSEPLDHAVYFCLLDLLRPGPYIQLSLYNKLCCAHPVLWLSGLLLLLSRFSRVRLCATP